MTKINCLIQSLRQTVSVDAVHEWRRPPAVRSSGKKVCCAAVLRESPVKSEPCYRMLSVQESSCFLFHRLQFQDVTLFHPCLFQAPWEKLVFWGDVFGTTFISCFRLYSPDASSERYKENTLPLPHWHKMHWSSPKTWFDHIREVSKQDPSKCGGTLFSFEEQTNLSTSGRVKWLLSRNRIYLKDVLMFS